MCIVVKLGEAHLAGRVRFMQYRQRQTQRIDCQPEALALALKIDVNTLWRYK